MNVQKLKLTRSLKKTIRRGYEIRLDFSKATEGGFLTVAYAIRHGYVITDRKADDDGSIWFLLENPKNSKTRTEWEKAVWYYNDQPDQIIRRKEK